MRGGRRPLPTLAAHAADEAIAASPEKKIIALTIDASIQKSLEELARGRARALGPDVSLAIVVADQASGGLWLSKIVGVVIEPSAAEHDRARGREPGYEHENGTEKRKASDPVAVATSATAAGGR